MRLATMHGVLSRIPVGKQKAVAGTLLVVAVVGLIAGVLIPMIEFTTTTETKTSGALWWRKTTTRSIPLDERLPYLLVAIGVFVVAVTLIAIAIRLFTMRGSLRKYVPILIGIESMPMQRLADITNSSKSKVYRDIQAMISAGMLSDFYVDYKAEEVVSKQYVPRRSRKTVVTCTDCGGRNELIVGITKACTFCGQPLELKKA